MSFNIKFYRYSGEPNKINKNIGSSQRTLPGTFKQSCDVMTPSILIQGDLSEFIQYNYMYIEPFDRYYFITDLVSVETNLVQINGSVDVLYSFKEGILNNAAGMVCRSSKYGIYNQYLEDHEFVSTADTEYVFRNWTEPNNGLSHTSRILILGGPAGTA